MKIAGLWSGHDCSFCVLEDGKPVIHAEYERYLREKEPKGDSAQFMINVLSTIEDIDVFTSCHPKKLLTDYESYNKLGKPVIYISHHQAHAAHAFFSSKFDDAVILTIDGGGIEDSSGAETATTIWTGKGNKITHEKTFKPYNMNIGGLWTRVTRYVFKLQNGWPYGHQAGSVMAMAALGDPDKYFEDFKKMLTIDILSASMKPKDQPVGPYVAGKDPIHPYLDKWAKLADSSEQAKFDLAAGLQKATEHIVFLLVKEAMQLSNTKNLCIAGGVALNSVVIGKIIDHLSDIVQEVYVPPVPYDGGLCLGAAQYHWHQILDNPRINWEDNFTPYLGESHKDLIDETLLDNVSKIQWDYCKTEKIVDLLAEGNIIAVFNGQSESGRRALGNRSILADPRSQDMKDKINLKVKHRQWFRPFAPSIMREHVSDWFENDVNSPYMTHVINFKREKRELVPAVVHFDGTARLQTVSKNDNAWYYSFLENWYKKTGVPIILNTSFNDREPICETPQHAIDCFMSTDIDYLYFVETNTLVRKK